MKRARRVSKGDEIYQRERERGGKHNHQPCSPFICLLILNSATCFFLVIHSFYSDSCGEELLICQHYRLLFKPTPSLPDKTSKKMEARREGMNHKKICFLVNLFHSFPACLFGRKRVKKAH